MCKDWTESWAYIQFTSSGQVRKAAASSSLAKQTDTHLHTTCVHSDVSSLDRDCTWPSEKQASWLPLYIGCQPKLMANCVPSANNVRTARGAPRALPILKSFIQKKKKGDARPHNLACQQCCSKSPLQKCASRSCYDYLPLPSAKTTRRLHLADSWLLDDE